MQQNRVNKLYLNVSTMTKGDYFLCQNVKSDGIEEKFL